MTGEARLLRILPVALTLALALAGAVAVGPAAAAAKNTLVLGVDISDTRTFDPARQFEYSPPITMRAAYETLVTMAPGDYVTVRPLLAESWKLVDGGKAWEFKLRKGVRFASGNPLTADDVKFSFERLAHVKDQPADMAENLGGVEVVDPQTVRLVMADKGQPLLTLLTSVTFAVYDSKTVMAQGGTSGKDAEKADKATAWLDTHSAGTGPYVLTGWTRNQEIVLERNKNYWRAPAAFERVVLRHLGDGAAQVLALRRGDVDAALNLSPDQLDSLAKDPNLRIVSAPSLDYMYLTLTSSPELNANLARKAARQAVAHAIDYDGIVKGLMGGHAIRPATFIPIGLGGSTEALTREIGYKQDLARAKKLLAEAGLPGGFAFRLSYGKASIAGTSYDLVAQKIQSDLARVGITADLDPLDQATLRTQYKEGKAQAVLTFWNPDAMEPYLWAQPSIGRVAKRVHWTPPKELVDLVTRAGGEPDPKKQVGLYREYQKVLVDQANYVILVQPIYRVATSKAITGYQLTAAGWQVNLYDVKPAK
ncbi:MAG TPA: ABC transporter substrate-binding protein [Methylomirabilota bacterium]|jgi:peptide/nickel transport system substrate-binding protein|nr:ABC transporter substrate-binding protein [Methylomirabilota bacterium]